MPRESTRTQKTKTESSELPKPPPDPPPPYLEGPPVPPQPVRNDLLPITRPICHVIREPENESATGLKNRCGEKAVLPCARCMLVAYCNEECRRKDWPSHKGECKSVVYTDDGDQARTVTNSIEFWAGYAAADVINIANNEGVHFDDVLRILLQGDFSVRHFIYSITKLPDGCPVKIEVVFNEKSEIQIARTIAVLGLLLPRPDEEPSDALFVRNAEAAIHMLYSAQLPEAVYELAYRIVIFDYKQHLNSCMDGSTEGKATLEDAKCVLGHGRWKLTVDLPLRLHALTYQHLCLNRHVQHSECRTWRALDLCSNAEEWSVARWRMSQYRYKGMCRWRQDGMLLPFGHPREGLKHPNPVLFGGGKDNPFPPGGTGEPLSEWPAELLDHGECPALNDAYGKMFYYLRDLFVRFQKRVKDVLLNITIISSEFGKLTAKLDAQSKSMGFDRLELGDEFEQDPHRALMVATQLLRHEYVNPCATALSITRKHELLAKRDHTHRTKPLGTPADLYAPPLADEDDMSLPDNKEKATLRYYVLLLFDDWDSIIERSFDSAMYRAWRPEGGAESVVHKTFMGMQRRHRHKVVTQPWPFRVVWKPTDNPPQRDVNRWISWARPQVQLWLEWRKAGDVDQDLFAEWVVRTCSERVNLIHPFVDSAFEQMEEEEEVGACEVSETRTSLGSLQNVVVKRLSGCVTEEQKAASLKATKMKEILEFLEQREKEAASWVTKATDGQAPQEVKGGLSKQVVRDDALKETADTYMTKSKKDVREKAASLVDDFGLDERMPKENPAEQRDKGKGKMR